MRGSGARKQSSRVRSLAIASALGLLFSAGAQSASPGNGASLEKSSKFLSKGQNSNFAVTGPLLIGPVEAVLANGKTVRVLGRQVDLQDVALSDYLLPADYVVVYGSMTSDGKLRANWIEKLHEVYSPGSSLVFHSGRVTELELRTGVVQVGKVAADGISIPDFTSWVNTRQDALLLIAGIQPAIGSPIHVAFAVSIGPLGIPDSDVTGITVQGIEGTGIQGIEGTGIQGIEGTGIPGIEGIGTRGIEGTGIQGIEGTGIQGIEGTGIQGIEGTGIQGIEGTGIQGIEGTGIQGIEGTGIQGIEGTGIQGIEGTGIQGIEGTGIQGIEGTGIQGIEGTGIQGIEGTGIQGIEGTGIQGIEGTGIQGIEGTGR
jgi:hypothetical protein